MCTPTDGLTGRPRILVVDDDLDVLRLYERQFFGEFDVVTSPDAATALTPVYAAQTVAVVVVDMHLPGMTGLEFLKRIEPIWPDAIRIMLTSDVQQATSVRAINEGRVAYFINKPASTCKLADVLRSGVESYRRRAAEKELHSSTVNGAVNLLVRILSSVRPESCGTATRVRRLAEELCRRMGIDDTWDVVVAALLSQLGTLTIPDGVLQDSHTGGIGSHVELELRRLQPRSAADLVAQIPRLSRIAEIIARQCHAWDGDGDGCGSSYWQNVQRDGAILRVALDFDRLLQSGCSRTEAIAEMEACVDEYQPAIFQSLKEAVSEHFDRHVRRVFLADLQPGMVLDEPVRDNCDRILVTRGQELEDWHLERLFRHHTLGGTIQQPIRVSTPRIESDDVDSRIEIPVPSNIDVARGAHAPPPELSWAVSA